MTRILLAIAGLVTLLALSLGLALPAAASESFDLVTSISSFAIDPGAVVLTVAFLGLTPMLLNYQPVFSIPGEGGGDGGEPADPDDDDSDDSGENDESEDTEPSDSSE